MPIEPPSQELEAQADALLAQHPVPQNAPYLTPGQLQYAARRDRARRRALTEIHQALDADPAEQVIRMEALRAAMQDLTLAERAIIHLSFFSQWTDDEIGAMLLQTREHIGRVREAALKKLERSYAHLS